MVEQIKVIKIFLVIIYFSEIGFGFSLKRRDDHCPQVKPMNNFNIFEILGSWYVLEYYSSAEEALTYHCMRTEFGLSNGNMDMKMRLTYKYAADPNDEMQTGNITWQIPDPRRPEHWRHTEDHYKGVYNTDVVDTDHTSWLILLHCSDPESEKKFLSTFVLSRTAYLDKLTTDYLREKVGQFDVDLEYLFPVNQTFCFGETNYPTPSTTTTIKINTEDTDTDDMYFAEEDDTTTDSQNGNKLQINQNSRNNEDETSEI